jgi:diketogulonate reductase-like aldo/keto reductase
MELAGAITQTTIPKKETSTGFELPVYGLGTWGIGGTFQADHSEDEKCVRSLRGCLEAGLTHIDTAEMYGAGHTEELIGRAISGWPREQLCISSKALAHHLTYDGLLRAAEGSIKRMQCDYLDIYMVHHPSDEIPIAETMRGMNELVRRGWVRQIGVSNFRKERLQEAQRHSPQKIELNQVHYSLAVREPERSGLLSYCQSHDMLLVAWQPIDRALYNGTNSPTLAEICKRYQRTPVQIALSWLTSQPGVVTISRTLSLNHLQENLLGVNTRMKPEDIELLRHRFEDQTERSDVYPLK